MEPRILQVDRKLVAGLSARTINTDEMDTETAKLPLLWDQFVERDIKTSVPNQAASHNIYGVYSDYESDVNGHYTLTVGMEVCEQPGSTHELAFTAIEPGKYLVFEARGEMPKAVIETWYTIWKYFSADQQYRRSYSTDFEMYTDAETVAIYIGVE